MPGSWGVLLGLVSMIVGGLAVETYKRHVKHKDREAARVRELEAAASEKVAAAEREYQAKSAEAETRLMEALLNDRDRTAKTLQEILAKQCAATDDARAALERNQKAHEELLLVMVDLRTQIGKQANTIETLKAQNDFERQMCNDRIRVLEDKHRDCEQRHTYLEARVRELEKQLAAT